MNKGSPETQQSSYFRFVLIVSVALLFVGIYVGAKSGNALVGTLFVVVPIMLIATAYFRERMNLDYLRKKKGG